MSHFQCTSAGRQPALLVQAHEVAGGVFAERHFEARVLELEIPLGDQPHAHFAGAGVVEAARRFRRADRRRCCARSRWLPGPCASVGQTCSARRLDRRSVSTTKARRPRQNLARGLFDPRVRRRKMAGDARGQAVLAQGQFAAQHLDHAALGLHRGERLGQASARCPRSSPASGGGRDSGRRNRRASATGAPSMCKRDAQQEWSARGHAHLAVPV